MRLPGIMAAASLLLLLPAMSGSGQSPSAPKPVIIRDTDIAEGIEAERVRKELNPAEAEKNIDVGNFYYKRKNYVGALARFLTAVEYNPDSDRAHKLVDKAHAALVDAYEKLDPASESLIRAEEQYGFLSVAVSAIEDFLAVSPDSVNQDDFRKMAAELKDLHSRFYSRR